jgi:hypothetical protein
MSGWALFQIATTLSMLGTQVQKDSVTFCPDAAGEEAAADEVADADAGGGVDAPVAGGDEVELPDEQPAATRTAMAAPAAAVTRRVLMSFMVPPQ